MAVNGRRRSKRGREWPRRSARPFHILGLGHAGNAPSRRGCGGLAIGPRREPVLVACNRPTTPPRTGPPDVPVFDSDRSRVAREAPLRRSCRHLPAGNSSQCPATLTAGRRANDTSSFHAQKKVNEGRQRSPPLRAMNVPRTLPASSFLPVTCRQKLKSSAASRQPR